MLRGERSDETVPYNIQFVPTTTEMTHLTINNEVNIDFCTKMKECKAQNTFMNARKYQTIIKDGKLDLPSLDLPEGTVVEAILLIKEPTEMDETDYLLSTEANRQHLKEAIKSLKNSDNYIYVDPTKL